MKIVREIKRDPSVREALQFYTNDYVIVRGPRLLVSNPDTRVQVDGEDVELGFDAISMQYTDQVAAVMLRAAEGATLSEMRQRVHETCDASPEEVDEFLSQLSAAGLLVSSLRPSPLGQPVADVLHNLGHIRTEGRTKIESLASDLERLDAIDIETRRPSEYGSIFSTATNGVSAKQAYQVDAWHRVSGALPEIVLNDVKRLAWLQIRSNPLGTFPGYRDRFLERYGSVEHCVPLLELVDSELGIGPPPEIQPEADKMSFERRCALIEIATRNSRSDAPEVEVSQAELDACLGAMPSREMLPDTLEIGFEIVAKRAEDIEAADYTIIPSPLAMTPEGGASIGRFADMLGNDIEVRLRGLHKDSEGGAIHAELVYMPGYDRAANVCIRPQLRDHQINFAATTRRQVETDHLSLQDLVVGLRADRFVVWSISLQREVRVHESHLLNPTMGSPPAYRFLSAVARDGRTFLSAFNWGTLNSLPTLPRVRTGRIVVSLARWVAPRKLFDVPKGVLPAVLSKWRDRWNVPRVVQLVQFDYRLPIDLETEIGREMLKNTMKKFDSEAVTFMEVYPTSEDCWMSDGTNSYRTEFFVSAAIKPPRASQPFSNAASVANPARKLALYSDWCYVKLYCGPRQADSIIEQFAATCRDLIGSKLAKRWFFLRFGDPFHHVRLRVNVCDREKFACVAEGLSRQCHDMMTDAILDRYVFDTYIREFERYGGPSCFDVVEDIFHEDSDMCAELLAGLGPDHDRRVFRALDALDRMLFHPLGERFVEAYLTGFGRPSLRLAPKIWNAVAELQRIVAERWISELPVANAVMTLKGMEAELRCSFLDVVNSLIHMHCNRMGIMRDDERLFLTLIWHTYNGLIKQDRLHRNDSRDGAASTGAI